MYDYKKIRKYIILLKEKFSLSVSLHSKNYDSVINSKELISFNIHDNSYCALIKSNKRANAHCIECQNKVLEKCQNGQFEGVCYAGVMEYVYPIITNDKTVGFISVSGYYTPNSESYIKKISPKYNFDIETLNTAYSTLKTPEYDKQFLDSLIYPLCDMLELAYSKLDTILINNETLSQKIENYLKQYRNQNITSKDICEHFGYSRSYISTEFNKAYNKTIREYLTELRINDAKSLLEHSDLSVTEIAMSIGFGDTNYFSYLFKKLTDKTPMEYRKASLP